ncbi:helix-turn-helix domain-containing protein [Desertivirga arenae]|uniref:helix-turn-helix domain-containing protein n=1 Tax=Desertivirga arenae TaxID=2810309 RepID=UPI001A961FFD|nr:helix-turn-helix transcriptional regulator [Pedobacter sp. SYSU D00823]
MSKIPIVEIPQVERHSEANGFSISELDSTLLGKERVRGCHRHNFFFILLIKKGSGIHEVDLVPYEVADNMIFCLRPGQMHQLRLESEAEGYVMRFNSDFYHPNEKSIVQKFRKATHNNLCPLDIDRFERVYSISERIFKEFHDKEEGYTSMIKASLDMFFIELVRKCRREGQEEDQMHSYKQERLEEFLDLLRVNLYTMKQVFQYTELMNLSAFQLNEITKTTIGKTASAIINEQIVLEAKRHLLALDEQVKVISEHLGYEDVSYFIRFFKKHTGYSPDLYRKNFR